jgi:vacuolar protein sorting-associated protein 33A
MTSSDQRRPAEETVDVSILREIARNSLVHALNSVSLFSSPFATRDCFNSQGQWCKNSRVGPFPGWTTQLGHGSISAPSTHQSPVLFFDRTYDRIQQHGVDKMFWLEHGGLTAPTTNIVYLCRPRITWVKIIAGIRLTDCFSRPALTVER